MAMTIHVDIVSAEKAIFSGRAEMVFATASLGEVGIAPQHAQLLTGLKPGQVRLQLPEGREEIFYISGGLLEVQPQTVTILADTALRADDIDEAAALEAKERAEQALMNRNTDLDYSRAAAELAESLAQLQAIRRLRHGAKGGAAVAHDRHSYPES